MLAPQRPEVAAATHTVYAYRLHEHNTVEENFDSDRDWSCGLELLKATRQVTYLTPSGLPQEHVAWTSNILHNDVSNS